jgi:hypothetical protein
MTLHDRVVPRRFGGSRVGMKPIYRLFALWALMFSLLLGGCDLGSGFVHGNSLLLNGCDKPSESRLISPFDMRFIFMGVLRAGNTAIVRMSITSEWPQQTDSLVVAFPDLETIFDGIAEQGHIMLDIGVEAVHVGLGISGRCPENIQALVAQGGWIDITEFGTLTGDKIKATFAFDLMDQRTGLVVGQGFQGELDFEVAVGTPYELFNDPAAQHGQ